jgi:hypothetical protein
MSESMDTKESTETQKADADDKGEAPMNPRPNRRISMLFPVILIAAGVLLLLAELDMLPDLHWEAALQLWPLLLIFIGLEIIVRLVPHPIGTILSLILALLLAGIFVFVLLYADEIPIVKEIVDDSAGEVKSEHIAYTAEGADAAVVSLELGSSGATLANLVDSGNLIEAEISYVGDLVFESDTTDGLASVTLGESSSTDWRYWINPARWFQTDDDRRWQIALGGTVPIDLDLDLSSGSADLDLEELTLSALNVDGASGSVDMVLPGGDYDMAYDVGSGSVTITLPDAGRHEFLLDGGSGSLAVLLPSTMEAMVIVADKGSGGLRIDMSRFSQIEAGDDGEGVWITAGYEDASDRITLILDTGSGNVSVDKE